MKKLISLIAMISIGGLLLIGCGNTNTKKDDTSSDSTANASTENNNSDKEYTVSSTETSNGKKVKEEEGTVLVNKEGIKSKVADGEGKKVDKELDTKLRKICEDLSGISSSKDIEARPFDGSITIALMGDVSSMSSRQQEITDYLKKNMISGYTYYVMIGSRTETGGKNFEVK